MKETLDKIRQLALGSWSGSTGEQRAEQVQKLLDRVLPEYSAVFGITEKQVLDALEGARNYCAVNYYQEANFPRLDNIRLFDTLEDFRRAAPSGRYLCPSCDGESTNPYECNTKKKRKDGSVCDWKSFGLLRTIGRGLRLVVRDKFLEHPRVEEIFMPIEMVGE